LSIGKEGKRWTVPTPWDETLEPLPMMMERKWPEVDKEEKNDLLPVIWSVAPESRTQGPRELEWVSPTKEIPVYAIDAMEPEFWRSSYHLRNSLKIIGGLEISDEVESMVEGDTGVAWTTAAVLRGRPCKA